MTQDEIIQMVQEIYGKNGWTEASLSRLEALVKLVAKAEREACAELCELQAKQWSDAGCFDVRDFKLCATAIRARGEQA